MKNDRFFGLHFDFHAKKDSPVGENTNADDIKEYIETIKPDYIQCDCKGHPGIASYPTKIGTYSDNMKADNLKIWVEAAHSLDTPIYVHYSGIDDGAYCEKYPEHSFNFAKDEDDIRANFFDDHYVKELLIPQLKELITDYKIDGVWVDGDCWAFGTEFKDSGYLTENMKPYLGEDVTKQEVDKALRDRFKVYLKTYVDELHEFCPEFKIISNWAYSSYMPEKVEVDVDFLSGDYFAKEASNGIRYEGRCMAGQGKLWDMMTWGFMLPDWSFKSKQQLCQEAASTLMLGGGFEVYMPQNADGSIKKIDLTTLKALSEFVRKREFNYGKKMISEIGIFYSSETRYQKGVCYNQRQSTQCLQGVMHSVLDAGFTADIALEHMIDDISKYEMFIVPEWELMSDNTKEKLKRYAENGGKLLIIGKELTSQFTGAEISENGFYIDAGGFISTGNVALLNGENKYLYSTSDLTRKSEYASYKTEKFGNGSITYIPFDLGSSYARGASYILRNFIEEVIKTVKDKKVEVNKKNIDVTLIDDGDGIILNLLNQNKNIIGIGEVLVYDEVPELYNLEIKVNGKFSSATPLLEGAESIEIFDDYALIKVNKLHIHTAFKLKQKG